MSRLISSSLLRAIMAAVPAAEVPGLIGEWAITLAENERHAQRIREQIAARGPRGFIRYADGRLPADDATLDAPLDGGLS
jgi:hypothetical protein